MLNKKKLYDTFTKVPTSNNTDSQLGGLRPQQNEGTKLDRTGHKVPHTLFENQRISKLISNCEDVPIECQ